MLYGDVTVELDKSAVYLYCYHATVFVVDEDIIHVVAGGRGVGGVKGRRRR